MVLRLIQSKQAEFYILPCTGHMSKTVHSRIDLIFKLPLRYQNIGMPLKL